MFEKGPNIKLSELKLPDFVLDLYYDLRDRHLLPLAILLVAAILAAPIVLSQSSGGGSEAEPPAAESAPATSSASSSAEELVARSAPGLRDYRRRLRHMRPKNPFEQQYTEGERSQSIETTGSSEEGPAPGTETSTGSSESPATESSPSETTPTSPPEGGPGPGELTYYSYAIDVRVAPGAAQQDESSESRSEATVRRNLPELTMLPSRKTPAVVYMGSSRDGKKALLLVSSDVKAIFGDGRCVLGAKTCELLALEPGLPETFVYGGEGKTYKIEILKIHLVETEDLNRAPLGKPQQHGK